ncbi:MAG TPA: hypothetical protein VFH26_00775 [Gemmatimonadales bacterium]|nr:hypothetical protein [Gemmatimonadales bacterium]
MIRGPAASVLFTGSRVTIQADTADTTANPQPTQWKRGLIIGGVIGIVGLGGFVYLLCKELNESGDSCVGTGLGGAALGAFTGGIIGALIGGQFPKKDDT